MANFDKLEQAVVAWVAEALKLLLNDPKPELSTSLRGWLRDEDGVFRERERSTYVWRSVDLDAALKLPAWQGVEAVVNEDERLREQMNTLLGTSQGSARFEAVHAGLMVLPRPGEIGDLEAAFARRYGGLDRFLGATEIEQTVIWPIPGLAGDGFPIELEPGLELDWMTDRELSAALDTRVLPLPFMPLPILFEGQDQQACMRYSYKLAKVIGEIDHAQATREALQREERLQGFSELLEQVLAVLFTNPVAISGRLSLQVEWSDYASAIQFVASSLTRAQQSRQLQLDEHTARTVVEIWRKLRRPGFLQQQKALALALRRLNYKSGRARIEDELVDLLVAGEALYLTDGSTQELSYRLALRATALANVEHLGMTRREVFDLMKSAYGVRSKIVHGDVPRPKDIKVKGAEVPLAQFVEAIEGVLHDAVQEALRRATEPHGVWPPDWDDLTLPR